MQRATTCNWNKFPAANRACSTRIYPGLHERYVNPRERSNRQACALFGHKCCIVDRKSKVGCSINQQSAKHKKENSPEVIIQNVIMRIM